MLTEENTLFTGIIEERGTLSRLSKGGQGNNGNAEVFINCSMVLDDTKIGDSISVNGICLTVTNMTQHGFAAHAAHETLQRTTLGNKEMQTGSKVNLERALTLQTRLGGHLVAGHIDTTAHLVSKITAGESQTLRFTLRNGEFSKYIVEKGSIAIDGISLTVTMVEHSTFEVVVIPHTLANTTLENISTEQKVNIETDIIARYAEKHMATLMDTKNNNKQSISELINLL